jgi:hypothetical protein
MARPRTCDAPVGGDDGEGLPFLCCAPSPAGHEITCPFCPARAYYCSREHLLAAAVGLDGHVLMQHPESVPEVIEALARDPARRAALERAATKLPARKVAGLVAAVRAAVQRAQESRPDGATVH